MLKTIKNKQDIKSHKFVEFEEYSHLSDERIIEKVLEGVIPLFEVLMRRYNQRLYRVQRSYISDEDAIKDTLQLTYIKAFENLDSFRGDSRFSTWITRIAINEALQYLKRQKRFTNLHLVDKDRPTNDYTVNSDNTPEDHAIQKDFKILLEKVVDNLPPKYKSVYIMRELEDMDTKETAGCLNLTTSNVKVRLHRAKQMIQDELLSRVADTEIFDFLGEQCDLVVFNTMNIIQSRG